MMMEYLSRGRSIVQNDGPRYETDGRQSMNHVSVEARVESLHLFGCKEIEILCNLSAHFGFDDYQ